MKSDVCSLAVAVMLNLIALIFLNACTDEKAGVPVMDAGSVTFVLKDVGAFTRSSLPAVEASVKNVSLFAYRDGFLIASGHWKSGEEMVLDLDADAVYDFYALANMGNVEFPVLEDDVDGFVYETGGVAGLGDAFPMCWSVKGYVPEDDPVEVCLTRLVAKVLLNVDCGDTGLKVTGVSLAQTPLSVSPFASGGSKAVAGKVSSGDHASASDLSLLNSGRGARFYMLENMQGTLLPDNRNPMEKVPGNLKDKSGVCTYVEVECEFMNGGGREGTATYRMYLGKDEMTNFDVERNTMLRLSLTLTSDGLKIKDSWKVTPDYIQHPTGLHLDVGTMNLLIGQKCLLSAMLSPADASDKRVVWQSSDAAIASVSAGGAVTARNEGVCTIRCMSVDRPELYAECKVTVSDAVSSLSFDKDRTEAVLGYDGESRTTDFTVYATFLSGKRLAVTDVCTYVSSSSSASVKVAGVVNHTSPGEALITATYQGVSATMTALTEAFAVSAVEFEQSGYSVSVGDGLTVRYRVLYNDGTSSGYLTYILLNHKCWSGVGYSVSDWSVASVNDYGRITPGMPGRTVLRVSVKDDNTQKIYEASVPLTVNEAYLVSVYADGPAMFYDGSAGPGLYGMYSDGSERNLTASASWRVGNGHVTYSPSAGIDVSDSHDMTEGVTLVTFTGTYMGMSAGVAMKYGKWVREVVFRKAQLSAGTYNYRMVVIYDDFTEEAVPFTYQTSADGAYWSTSRSGTASGVTITATVPATRIRGRTSGYYYDYQGNSLIWSVGY